MVSVSRIQDMITSSLVLCSSTVMSSPHLGEDTPSLCIMKYSCYTRITTIMNHHIKVTLVSKSLRINGIIPCFERLTSNEYKVPHEKPGTKEEFPGPHYEIEVSHIIPQILPEESSKSFFQYEDEMETCKDKKRRKDEEERLKGLVEGLHIEIGRDLKAYMCCPNLPEEKIVSVSRLWLAHQALYHITRLNIGLFEGYFLYKDDDIEQWILKDLSRWNTTETVKENIRKHESLFKEARRIYCDTKNSEKRLIDIVTDIVLGLLDAYVYVEIVDDIF